MKNIVDLSLFNSQWFSSKWYNKVIEMYQHTQKGQLRVIYSGLLVNNVEWLVNSFKWLTTQLPRMSSQLPWMSSQYRWMTSQPQWVIGHWGECRWVKVVDVKWTNAMNDVNIFSVSVGPYRFQVHTLIFLPDWDHYRQPEPRVSSVCGVKESESS